MAYLLSSTAQPAIDQSAAEPSITSTKTIANTKFFWDNVYFQVEDELFCVPRCEFEAASEVFADMFQIPQGARGTAGQTEGADEANPIVLEGYSKADFECLLAVMYPRSSTSLSKGEVRLSLGKEELISVLKLSTVWDMKEIRKYAIHTLSTRHCLSAVDKVRLARDHKVAKWLQEGVMAIISDDFQMSIDDLAVLGWEIAARILWIKSTSSTGVEVEDGSTEVYLKTSALRCLGCSGKVFPDRFRSPCVSCDFRDDTLAAANKHIQGGKKVKNRLQLSLTYCRACEKFPYSLPIKCHSCTASIVVGSFVEVTLPRDKVELIEEAFGKELKDYELE